jgi:hypothetical protein
MYLENNLEIEKTPINKKSISRQYEISDYFNKNVSPSIKKFIPNQYPNGVITGGERGHTSNYLNTKLMRLNERINSLIYAPTMINKEGVSYIGTETNRIDQLKILEKNIKDYSGELRKLGVSPTFQKELYKKLKEYHEWATKVGKEESLLNWVNFSEEDFEKLVEEQIINKNTRTSFMGSGKEVKPVNKLASKGISF